MAEFKFIIETVENRICQHMACKSCPIRNFVKDTEYDSCGVLLHKNPEEYERIVLEWLAEQEREDTIEEVLSTISAYYKFDEEQDSQFRKDILEKLKEK